MDSDQQGDILDAISRRGTWENDMRRWYAARHRGPGRMNKPYPRAPDLHFPLCDSLIGRTKPFYIQQLYMSENIASFRPLFQQDTELTEQLQAWFDYQLKQHSNLEEETYSAIDEMLVSGRGILGVYWDNDKNRLAFYEINPLYFVVPNQVDDLDRDAAWLLHIEKVTKAQYKANKNYNQDPDFISKITGGEGVDSSQRQTYEIKKAYREGLTYTTKDDILIWNLYTRQSDGKILAETVSPSLPVDGDPIREPFALPYNKGVFKEGAYPFSSMRYEIKDKGWYAPRGIIEMALPFENSLSALWNAKHEYMDFACRPTFELTQPMGNMGNIRRAPGDVAPFGVKMSENPPPPMSFGEEMQNTRAVAEYLIQIPDLGANAHLAGPAGYRGEKPTATQIQAIMGLSNQSNDLRGRIFKMDFGKTLAQAWSILIQYATENLTYFVGKTSYNIPPNLLRDDYEIELNVSADSWNKEAQMQKAAAMMQLFGQSPYVDTGVLTRKALDGFIPGLSRDAFRDPGMHQQDEVERQNVETVEMLNRFSVAVKPFDDDKAHLFALQQFAQVRAQENLPPPDPQTAQAFVQHIQGHLSALGQKKDPAAKQIAAQFTGILQVLGSLASQPPQGAGTPMAPGMNGQAQPPPPPMASGAPGASPASQDKPSAVANALANLLKAGAQVSTDDVNAILVRMGLPPMATSVAPTQQHLKTAQAVADAISPQNNAPT